jgi:hypothetical protein
MALLNIPSLNLPGGTKENHENVNLVVILRAEIWNRDLPNMKQECWPLGLKKTNFRLCNYRMFDLKRNPNYNSTCKLCWLR